MNFIPTIIWRYLRARRGFTGVVTGFSVAGILLGVAALIVVMCVMAGFREELISRILGMTGHASLASHNFTMAKASDFMPKIKAVKGVTAVRPIVQGQVMVTVNGQASGALVRGVLPTELPAVVQKSILAGEQNALKTPQTIAIGQGMSTRLGLSVGDVITLLSPDGAHTMFGFVPRIVQAKVGIVFDTGLQAYDNGMIIMPIKFAQTTFKMGQKITALEIEVANPTAVNTYTSPIITALNGNANITTWQQSNRPFFQALQVERITMFVILSLIIIVAVFNIITGQIMLVTDKTPDISILRTMGATRKDILKIFLLNGLLLGGLGTFAGFALGTTIVINLKHIVGWLENLFGTKVFSSGAYPIDTMPAVLVWNDIFAVLAMSLILTLLASLYPAWKASKLAQVEGL